MNSRRDFLVGAAAVGLASCAAPKAVSSVTSATSSVAPSPTSPDVVGVLSGRAVRLPDVDPAPMPRLAPGGAVHDGVAIGGFGIDGAARHPDVRSFRRKLGVLVPATNTSVEHELWRLVFDNRETLAGVGLHTVNVATPVPKLETAEDLARYQRQFVSGLGAAVDQALLAKPHVLIMGMSLEHILHGIEPIRALAKDAEARAPGVPWATWHDAALAALTRFGAHRIGLLTPFDARGNDNARRMFEDLGFEVVSTFGFACADALHIAHVPDEAKSRAIREKLASPQNRLDAIVQCGTNMSLVDVAERLEPELGIPILGINAVTFWYALRESGIAAKLQRGGRLLREA